MSSRYKRKLSKTLLLKILMMPLLLLLSFAAIKTGIATGNLLYTLDTDLIGNMDAQNFKSTINTSFPIINSVYNSGNVSVSFSGEIKNLLKGIFQFDMDSPLTILNVQSPLFLSYYNKEYKTIQARDEPLPQAGDGQSPQQGPQSATNGNNTDQPKKVTDNENGQVTPKGEDNANVLPQVASSITYEAEDEEEKEQSDIVSHDKIVVQNYTKFKIDIAQLLKETLNIKFDKKGPKVLVYHTHTTESYVIKLQDIGKKGIPSYTTDPRYNVVRVGEELARNLKKYSIDVLHNGTVHDSDRNAAYGVAIKTLDNYKKSYPSIKVFLDIHRDGLDPSKPKLNIVKKINGKNTAQVMFVVGTNGMLPHTNWKENLTFALKLQQKLNEKYPGLARPVWISSKRYNQQLSNDALIIEIGGDGNLLSECLESTKYLAEVLNEVMKGK